ncbi:uncharacterized protein LAJ45_01230 [Morchella importuna]|uniref:uncharacterized protein n=1 Tax=Morchella importuna TaxID=1174673 RepID=UPI001E8D987E|nr:uncharacterized protein LAJ45_01230 [Morchella importuna]KAH8154699.1 hypothetical protein LAJ45_01230 [Morchella importuna]
MYFLRAAVVAIALQLSGVANGDVIEDRILAKIYGVATKGKTNGVVPTPTGWPEYVIGTATSYTYQSSGAWTTGFFPGTLWLLYQRSLTKTLKVSSAELLSLARTWQAPLRANKDRTDTHDLGFMIHDCFGWDAILTGNATARQTVHDAAIALSQRYNSVTKTIRSWGSISDTGSFTVIIDNMMNLGMLYWAAQQFGNTTLSDIATSHATTTMNNHFRTDGSTWHVLNYNQVTGAVTAKYTNQGYSDSSTWARGQAWAIYGMVSAYRWTKNTAFLDTAIKAADYFLAGLPADGVPYWDFNAPVTGLRDTSAGTIVASGLLYLVEQAPAYKDKYLQRAIDLIDDTIALSQSPPAVYTASPFAVSDIGFNAFLMNGTIDNNPAKTHTAASSNTGLVYGDYYLIEAQNRLLGMGLLAA